MRNYIKLYLTEFLSIDMYPNKSDMVNAVKHFFQRITLRNILIRR